MPTFNYDISGVASTLQYGSGGGSMVWNTDHFESTSDGTTLANLRVPLAPVNANDIASKNYVDTLPRPYEIVMWYPATPTANEIMFTMKFTTIVTFQDNFSASAGSITTNPTTSFVMSVERNTVQIGTITINTTGVFTFDTIAATTEVFAIGDTLTIKAPAVADATAAAIYFTLKGTR